MSALTVVLPQHQLTTVPVDYCAAPAHPQRMSALTVVLLQHQLNAVPVHHSSAFSVHDCAVPVDYCAAPVHPDKYMSVLRCGSSIQRTAPRSVLSCCLQEQHCGAEIPHVLCCVHTTHCLLEPHQAWDAATNK